MHKGIASVLHLAGAPYWTASVLPAMVGTTLPLWLRRPGFVFRGREALEFLIATLLVHAGFSLLLTRFESRTASRRMAAGLLIAAMACIVLACVLGVHLMRSTPDLLFTAYGLAVLFAGVIYVVPPARFSQRLGGEIVVAMSLGLLPVLGAYLVQTGDLTRKVYIAALPIYAAMLLWVWTEQMAASQSYKGTRGETLVTVLGSRLSGRVVVPGLSALLGLTLLAAVLSSSVMPGALVALVLYVPIWRIVVTSWRAYGDAPAMTRTRTGAMVVHAGLCLVLIVSSVWAVAD